MTLDEYETIRLIDLEEYTQHECAKTDEYFQDKPQQRFIKAQDTRWQTALWNGKKLLITGGNYPVLRWHDMSFCKKHCNRAANSVRQSKILQKRKVRK